MRKGLLIIILSVVASVSIYAQSAQDPLSTNTPAGQQMAEWLRIFNTGNTNNLRHFISEHFPQSALERVSVDDRAAKDAGLYVRTQGLYLRRIEKSESYAIVVLAQERLDEGWVRINIGVETAPPHRIADFGIRRIPRPADIGAPGKLTEAEVMKDIEAYLKKMVATNQFSGAVLIAKNGKPIFEQAYGLASKAFNVRNRIDTKFNLASMNKMFTAVAIAQLAEQGKLTYDAPIVKYLPDYPNKSVAEKVTIQQLLTHTSGLGDFFNEKFEARKTRLRAVQDYFPLFIDDALLFEPGQKWRYSNAGFIVLGAIIEKVSGQNYFDYVGEHIYQPAGMIDTDSYETDQDVANRAIGYTEIGPSNRAEPGPLRNNLIINPVKGSPAGGGYSTVEDMLRFDIALRQHKLLSEKSTDLVLTGKVGVGVPGEKYGYGFMVGQTNGHRIVGHGGTSPGANAKFDMYPDLGYTVIVLSNYDPRAAERVADRFRERITRN
jgi:CubicO group peptidase (beta-lactamase class C family)